MENSNLQHALSDQLEQHCRILCRHCRKNEQVIFDGSIYYHPNPIINVLCQGNDLRVAHLEAVSDTT